MLGVTRFVGILVLSWLLSITLAEESPSPSPTIHPSLFIQNTSSPSIAPSQGNQTPDILLNNNPSNNHTISCRYPALHVHPPPLILILPWLLYPTFLCTQGTPTVRPTSAYPTIAPSPKTHRASRQLKAKKHHLFTTLQVPNQPSSQPTYSQPTTPILCTTLCIRYIASHLKSC